jgi:aminoglycoside phosphotransferase (APT) family kinase protein
MSGGAMSGGAMSGGKMSGGAMTGGDGLLDQGRAVRGEDAFDLDALMGVLRAQLPGVQAPPAVRQFPGGASNLTYLLSWPDQELVLRRPPRGQRARGAHDMLREARVLQALRPVYPLVPEVVAVCEDPAPLGAPFYLMRRIPGMILRGDLPRGLSLDPAEGQALCRSVLDALLDLHAVDVQAAGLEGLGRGPGYARRQIDGWSQRYRDAHTEGCAPFERVMAWLDARCPEDAGASLIHGDFRFDNVVLDVHPPHPVRGVLDWEMATVGCPLMDWGASLAYWVEAEDDLVMHMMRRQPTHLPGMLRRAEVWALVAERRGQPIPDTDFYEVYGLFRLATILQQIWLRFTLGQTQNPAFAAFGDIAVYLESRCHTILDRRGEG